VEARPRPTLLALSFPEGAWIQADFLHWHLKDR
jgi:hypothetical protein